MEYKWYLPAYAYSYVRSPLSICSLGHTDITLQHWKSSPCARRGKLKNNAYTCSLSLCHQVWSLCPRPEVGSDNMSTNVVKYYVIRVVYEFMYSAYIIHRMISAEVPDERPRPIVIVWLICQPGSTFALFAAINDGIGALTNVFAVVERFVDKSDVSAWRNLVFGVFAPRVRRQPLPVSASERDWTGSTWVLCSRCSRVQHQYFCFTWPQNRYIQYRGCSPKKHSPQQGSSAAFAWGCLAKCWLEDLYIATAIGWSFHFGSHLWVVLCVENCCMECWNV